MLLPPRLANTIITLVSVVWMANFFAQFVPGLNYHPDIAINGIFMGIVGGSIALSRKRADPPPALDAGEPDVDPDDEPEPDPGPPPRPNPRTTPPRSGTARHRHGGGR